MEENSFARRLKNLLEEKQLTLTQVANAIGKSPPSVHRWTHGGEIDYANLRALANYLGVSWIWLRYGDEALQDLQSDPSASEALTEQRRKYLGEIMENEARMHLAQEMANIVTWELNILTGEVTASSNAEKVFGQALQELKDFWIIFHDKDLDELTRLFASPDKTYEWDYRMAQATSDNNRWFTSRGLLITDAQQRPIKIIGVSIDMTERKRMETALQRSEYTLRKVIETIPVGLWIADKNGKIITANPEVQRIWGGAKYVGLDEYGEYKGWWEATGKKLRTLNGRWRVPFSGAKAAPGKWSILKPLMDRRRRY
jgi:PAS domain-containing protein